MSWSEGYFSGLGYVHGHYPGMNPLWMRFICLFAGLEPPAHAPWQYLELGFGQGISLNIHAAANEGEFWGNDFNASHVAYAADLAAKSQSNATILEDSFRQFAQRNDLPKFDFICLHGIWSWVSAENRQAIVQILGQRLKVGGLVYISYNCLPGWSPLIAVRELMVLHHSRNGQLRGARASIEDTIAFTTQALRAQPGYLQANPVVEVFLENLGSEAMGRNYIAHEYLNRDWHIPTFAATAADLSQAKLDYVGSTQPHHNIDKFRLNEEAREFAAGLGDLPLQETVKDFFLNTKFRSDIFIKGPRQIPSADYCSRWLSEYFVMTRVREDLPDELKIGVARIVVKGSLLAGVADALRGKSYRPKTVREISEAVGTESIQELIDALVLLVDAGCASPARIPNDAALQRCRLFNRHVLARALVSPEIECLASPVTAGGIAVPHVFLLFMVAWEKGHRGSDALAAFAGNALSAIFGLPDRPVDLHANTRNAMDRLSPLAEDFMKKSLPVLQALIVL